MKTAVRQWVLVVLVSVSFPVQATLMQRDLTSSGDALLTFDPATSIEWLDLPPTLRKSVDDVEAGFGSYASQGFTVPMVDDVLGFFEGIAPFRLTTESETVEKYIFLDAGQAFELFMLGPTVTSPVRADVRGWAARDDGSGLYSIVSAIFLFDSSMDITGASLVVQHGQFFDGSSGANPVGVYLNRAAPVPEPTTAALLALGLLGAGFTRRRIQ